jgi:hypothetical protein
VTANEVTEELVDQLYKVFLQFTQSMTPHEAVKNLQLFGASESNIRAVRERHETESLKIRNLDEPASVYLDGRRTWYTGPDMEKDRNWPALESSMARKGFGGENIASIDKSSTKIVALLDHPKQDGFRTRGLVVGFVQSGKTTNFTAVMATELEWSGSGYGGWGSRVRPVWARNPSMSSGRYWMRLSNLLALAASWSRVPASRLPRSRLTCAHTPSVALSSGA